MERYGEVESTVETIRLWVDSKKRMGIQGDDGMSRNVLIENKGEGRE